jgi:hypothetical protein
LDELISCGAFSIWALAALVHYVVQRRFSSRLLDHLRAEHEDGWRAAGGPIVVHDEHEHLRAPLEKRRVSRYAAWRWLRKRAPQHHQCDDCRRLHRDARRLLWSFVSATFLVLVIHQLWGGF